MLKASNHAEAAAAFDFVRAMLLRRERRGGLQWLREEQERHLARSRWIWP